MRGRRAAPPPSGVRRRPSGSNFLPWETGLKTRKYGAASVPDPATHCQPWLLLARSPSTSQRRKCRAPCCHSTWRSLTRKLATIIRTRLCIQPCRAQLAHPGVDDGIAGAAALPGEESLAGLVIGHPRELGLVVVARRRGVVPQHVGVELPPAQLGAVRRRPGAAAAGEVGEHRPGVDLAPLEVHRHARGAVDAGLVAIGLVVVDRPVEELVPTAQRRPLACLGQLDAVGQGGSGMSVVSSTSSQVAPPLVGRASIGPRQPWLGPRAREGREDLVGAAVGLRDPAGRDGVRRTGADQLDAGLLQRRARPSPSRRLP